MRLFSISRIRSRPTRRSRRADKWPRRCARAASAAARSSSASMGRIRPGATTISPPPPPPGRTRSCCPRSTVPARSWPPRGRCARPARPSRTRIWAMMETPNAVLNAGSIAAVAADSASRFTVMVMGLNDLAKETRARLTPGRPTMTAWLASCAIAARAHGVEIIDGVFNDIKDLDGFRLECLQGRDMGLDGKTLIHPSQIDTCNEVFAPCSRGGRKRPRHHRSFRAARERRQGRDPAQRPHGRTSARRHGPPDAGDRRGNRRAPQGGGLRPRRQTFFSRTITSIALISVPSGAGISNSGSHSSGMSESSSVSSR